LFAKHPILLAKIFNDLQLAVVHPPRDGDHQKPEWVEHSLRFQNPLSRPPSGSSESSHLDPDPIFGPYGFDPRRLRDDYVPTGFAGHGVNTRPVRGHEFGLKLSSEDKAALMSFLKTL
jgi:hypothetical protein